LNSFFSFCDDATGDLTSSTWDWVAELQVDYCCKHALLLLDKIPSGLFASRLVRLFECFGLNPTLPTEKTLQLSYAFSKPGLPEGLKSVETFLPFSCLFFGVEAGNGLNMVFSCLLGRDLCESYCLKIGVW
jgi:hypothetical protein